MGFKKRKTPGTLSKQEQAHYKNLFSKKIMEIAGAVSLHGSYRLITAEMIDDMFRFRSNSIKVITDESFKISPDELKKIKDFIVLYMKGNKHQFKVTGYELSLYDWAGPGLTLYLYLCYLKRERQEQNARLLCAFEDFINCPELWDELMKKIMNATYYVGWYMSSPEKKLYSLITSYKGSDTVPTVIIEVKIKEYQPEFCNVTLNGISRPVYRIAVFSINCETPTWISIESERVGLENLPAGTLIPIYIQIHALKRLKERIDYASNALIYCGLLDTFENPVCVWYNGNLLIEYIFNDIKIGYLLLDVLNEKVVIRTFLMLTHLDTPEGDKLNKLIGFAKTDISFMNLDKLSTFVHTDFDDKSILKDLCIQAGCESLFEVRKRMIKTKNDTSAANFIESQLIKYQQYHQQFNLEELKSA